MSSPEFKELVRLLNIHDRSGDPQDLKNAIEFGTAMDQKIKAKVLRERKSKYVKYKADVLKLYHAGASQSDIVITLNLDLEIVLSITRQEKYRLENNS